MPFLVVLLVAAAAVSGWWIKREQRPPKDRLVLNGNVDVREARLAFEVSGRIRALDVREGERVAAGQRLAVLDDGRYRDAVDLAEARLGASREKLRQLEAGSRPEEIDRARAEVEAARAQAQNALVRYRRLRDMAQRQLVSPQDVDDARTAHEAAQADLNAARKSLALVLAGPREEEVAAARQEVKAAEAQVQAAKRDLRDTELTAPAVGIIRTRVLESGDMASPQQPVFTLALTDPVWARVYLPETALGQVAPGTHATVTTDGDPGREYRAWVGYISPTAEFTPKSVETEEVRPDLVYQARVMVCDPGDGLRLGMPVTVTIRLDAPATGAESACEGAQ
jgi:HlyD family secretion protein